MSSDRTTVPRRVINHPRDRPLIGLGRSARQTKTPRDVSTTSGLDTEVTRPSAVKLSIAWALCVSGNSDVYVMNADGSGVTQITTDPAIDGVSGLPRVTLRLPRWYPRCQASGVDHARGETGRRRLLAARNPLRLAGPNHAAGHGADLRTPARLLEDDVGAGINA